jgi:hypothetical protein
MMGQRQDTSITTKDRQVLTVTVSEEFGLVKLDDGRNEITLDLHDFTLLAKWVEKRK